MWQETRGSSRKARSPTNASSTTERSRSYSPHQCQIRRLYKAIEAIETPHLDALLSRGSRSPAGDDYRGTLGGFAPIVFSEEKQRRESICKEKEVDDPVPRKAANLLGCYDDVAQRSRARRTRSERIPLSKTEVRPANWYLDKNLSVTPPETPIVRESFELEGDWKRYSISSKRKTSNLVITTAELDGANGETRYAVELDGTPAFSSVSWSGENRYELPATPTDAYDHTIQSQPLRRSKSSICVSAATNEYPKLQPQAYDVWKPSGVVEDHHTFKSCGNSRSSRQSQPRPFTICNPQSASTLTTSSNPRSQGLRKVKARHDLKKGPRILPQYDDVPIITVTDPTFEATYQSSGMEKAEEAGFALTTIMDDAKPEERKWEEITQADELKLCMAVLSKEIARRKMERGT